MEEKRKEKEKKKTTCWPTVLVADGLAAGKNILFHPLRYLCNPLLALYCKLKKHKKRLKILKGGIKRDLIKHLCQVYIKLFTRLWTPFSF